MAVVQITVSIEIAAPLERVWAEVADLASHAEWMADAESIVFLTDQRSGAGTRMQVATRVGPLRTSDVMEIVEWTERLAIGVRHEGLSAVEAGSPWRRITARPSSPGPKASHSPGISEARSGPRSPGRFSPVSGGATSNGFGAGSRRLQISAECIAEIRITGLVSGGEPVDSLLRGAVSP